MNHYSPRSLGMLGWKYLRWAPLMTAIPVTWWACTSHPLAQPTPQPVQESDVYISVSPVRQLDLVFMIDNSPSMAPKQAKLQAQFHNLLTALEDPTDGTLPDLRVAIIDSDLGTNGAYSSGSCGPKTLADGTVSNFGDLGRFQMIGAQACGVTDSSALWLEYAKGQPVNYTGDINNVFACLAGNLGTLGCGEEHQLQAFEFALVAKGISNETQQTMIRPSAYLGLVFLSDEDDCSAATDDGMFGDKPELAGESASLRCSTRAYTCNGTNLTSAPPGYPTTAAFQTAFANCAARTDACPDALDGGKGTDTSVSTGCSPLRDYVRIANEMMSLKSDPTNQLLVAGIFGWPIGGDMSSAEPVKFALRPNPNTADTQHPLIYDYWSLCYDPNHRPQTQTTDSQTGFDADAWGWGAGPGLRESAFIDQFGANGLKFSICETDYSGAMSQIGNAIAIHLQNLCVNYKLLDKDPTTPGVQADCRVAYRTLDANGVYQESPDSLPQCSAGATSDTISSDCWQLVNDTAKCTGLGQLVNVLRTRAEINAGPLAAGTKIDMQCLTCTDPLPGQTPVDGCNY